MQDPGDAEEGTPHLEAGVAPACVALVDASGGEAWLELVKNALLAGLEALPPGACFGLATFGRQARAGPSTCSQLLKKAFGCRYSFA